jgi:hypothetical protein
MTGRDVPSPMAALAADPTGARLGLALPAGRIVPDTEGDPALWLSTGAVDEPILEHVHAEAGRTGLWPIALNLEGFTQPVEPGWPTTSWDAEAVFAAWSGRYRRAAPGDGWYHSYHGQGCEWCEAQTAVLRSGPGAFAAQADQTPAATAAAVAASQLSQAPYLGLVACARSADIPAALGWDGPANRHEPIAKYSAVLGRWEERYGARVVALHGASLVCSVARPPRSMQRALELADEHAAFCPDQAGAETAEMHAATLIGASYWPFWWD